MQEEGETITREMQERLREQVFLLGAGDAAWIGMEHVVFRPEFREICQGNGCGLYGRCWMCPPAVGRAEDLIARAKSFDAALVYRTVGTLEDCFDIEGMLSAGERHNELSRRVQRLLRQSGEEEFLHLGAGGCRRCPVCAKAESLPCRFPDEAIASLEGYCIDAGQLAKACGMQYYSGPDTVTYFSAALVRET